MNLDDGIAPSLSGFPDPVLCVQASTQSPTRASSGFEFANTFINLEVTSLSDSADAMAQVYSHQQGAAFQGALGVAALGSWSSTMPVHLPGYSFSSSAEASFSFLLSPYTSLQIEVRLAARAFGEGDIFNRGQPQDGNAFAQSFLSALVGTTRLSVGACSYGTAYAEDPLRAGLALGGRRPRSGKPSA